MITKENKRLIVMILTLAVLNLGLFIWDREDHSLSFDVDRFAINDPESVSSITLVNAGEMISITRSGDQWLLNNTYPVDRRMGGILFTVLDKVKVKKPVELQEYFGVEVSILGENPQSFTVIGNPTKTRTYFHDQETNISYEVEIPGYQDYIGSVFELKKDQWRDRLLLNATSRTIQRLWIRYPDQSRSPLDIRFEKESFVIQGVTNPDEDRLLDYLDQFQHFEVNERISEGNYPEMDSLKTTPPIAELNMLSINFPDTVTWRFFAKLPNQNFQLVMTEKEEMVILDAPRVRNILISPSNLILNADKE